jgi:hypothetical protein
MDGIYKDIYRREFLSYYDNLEESEMISEPESSIGQKYSYQIMAEDEEEMRLFEELQGSLINTPSAINEYDRYINLSQINTPDSILIYWKENSKDFPKLSRMTRDYLAIPSTSAGIERQFNRSGNIIRPLRNRLSPETISDIMMYKDYLARKGRVLEIWEGAGMEMGTELAPETQGISQE